MKRNIILFLLSLSTVIVSFSQTTYPLILNDSLIVITPQQLKTTNLIFSEHKHLKLHNEELQLQLCNYELLLQNYEFEDSLQTEQHYILLEELENCSTIVAQQNVAMDKLKSKNKIYKGISIGGISLSILLFILLL